MPTALNVLADEAITPAMKKKQNADADDDSEGNKITPAPGSSTAKKAQPKKAQQPSIMSFFQQPSSNKNLFDKSTDSTKKSSPPTTTTSKSPAVETTHKNDGDDESASNTTKSASPLKPSPVPTKRSSIPTKEDLRAIMMGTCASDLDEEAAASAPVVKEKESTNAAPTKQKSPEKDTLVDAGLESIVESTAESSSEAEEAVTEEEPHDSLKEEEASQSGDDDTVAMSPMKQNRADAAEEEEEAKLPEETTVESKKAKEDVPVESITTDNKDECVDLSAAESSDAPTKASAVAGPETPKSDDANEASAKKPPPPSPSSMKPAAVPSGVTAERRTAWTKNETLRTLYQSRLDGLVQRGKEGLEEENFELPAPAPVETLPEEGTTVSSPLEFPECAIPSLALIVQESRLPLTDLAATALIQLKELYPDGIEFHAEGIAAKIKLLATRESYVQTSSAKIANSFEDENADRMWRWEIISLELLPDDCMQKIKKARTQRKKLRSHSKALCTLLKYLDQSAKLLEDPKSSQAKCNDVASKISSAEEKVLKYEREEEKVRLASAAKKQKESAKAKTQSETKKKKALAAEQKKKERALAAEQKKKEKELKKQAAAKEREDKKRKKEEEKKKAEQEQERKIKKQRTMMKSFFTHQASPAKKTKKSEPKETPVAPASPSVDSDNFWSRLNKPDQHVGGPLFPSLTSKAVASRKRRTRVVPVQVFATVLPSENAFDQQPYAELQTIHIPNKYKFLSFREDCRPPYHGTWSKSSSLVTGRNPIGKDSQYLDYDIDSEAEWEEGDDEIGEDCEADGPDEEENMDDEEGDTRMYNYQDGWLAADDDLGTGDEVDEDTKLLRKKKLQGWNSQQKAIADQATICIIAPGKGGVPSDEIVDNLDDQADRIEGVSPSDARDLVVSHTGTVLRSEGLCLDAFPPPLVEEGNLDVPPPSKGSGSGKTSSNNEMSRSDLITFVKFVHHSKFASKDKLVEELRTKHEKVTSSRAQATRKLDSIAEKKRYPGGVYWEVRRDVLEELGLAELLNKEFELPPPQAASEKNASKKPKASPNSSADSATPAPAKASKPKKDSPTAVGKDATPAASTTKASTSGEKSLKKKRTAPAGSAKLFANFLQQKKPKTQE